MGPAKPNRRLTKGEYPYIISKCLFGTFVLYLRGRDENAVNEGGGP